MSINNPHNLFKQNQNYRNEIRNLDGQIVKSSDDRLSERNKIQREWKQKQYRGANKIWKEQTQANNIKKLLKILGILTTMIFMAGVSPSVFKFGHQKFTEILIQDQEAMTEGNEAQTKPSLEYQIKKTFLNIQEYNQNLQKAIDVSDGKEENSSQDNQ